MYFKTVVNNGKNYQPQLVTVRCQPSKPSFTAGYSPHLMKVGEGILSLPAGIAAGTGIFTALLIMVAFYLVPLGRMMIVMVMLMTCKI